MLLTPISFRFTLRELLGGISSVACVLVGWKSFGLFGASVVSCFVSLLMILAGRRTAKQWMSLAGKVLLIPSLGMSCLTLLGILYFGIGPIYSEERLPYGFEDMVKITDADASNSKVYCRGSFIDSEYVWRLTLTDDQWTRVFTKLSLVKISSQAVPAPFWTAFPLTWRPIANASCQFFATTNFPDSSRGPDGDHYLTMYDPGSGQFYVWHKSNF